MLLHAVDGVDDVLDRLDDVVLDRLGRGARILHRDVRLRHADLGHLLDRQQPIGEQAEHDQREHDHGREDGLIDAGAGDPHGEDWYGVDRQRRDSARRRASPRTTALAPALISPSRDDDAIACRQAFAHFDEGCRPAPLRRP